MKKTIRIRYKIYQNVEGLLKHPVSHWSNHESMFNTYGYETEQEALTAILEEEYASDNLCIVACASIGWGD